MSATNQSIEIRFQTCHAQHQAWADTLARNEQEIDQLLTLLAELPSHDYQRMRQYTVEYAQSLQRIKQRIHRLRVDVVCTGAACVSARPTPPPAPCPEPLFVTLPAQSSTLINTLSSEYDRIKTRCNAFVGELMGLNLI